MVGRDSLIPRLLGRVLGMRLGRGYMDMNTQNNINKYIRVKFV